ncbi:MAG: tRNA uridine-5-carboxymethylaminomethyl(34) synthesis GTPase MnmE [Sumerlaeia bacterium]
MSRSISQQSNTDTIIARATPAGSGAIAIVRLSGPQCHSVAKQIFLPRFNSPEQPEAAKLLLGEIKNPASNAVLDECLAAFWYGPNSFTGEDCVEFHLHGSPVVVGEVISLSLSHGARLAQPGEFSQRAYKNGKVDLAQAEAICDLISARTVEASRFALQQLSGGLSRKCEEVRMRLVRTIAELEAYVDFPDEGLGIDVSNRIVQELSTLASIIKDWLVNARRGIATRDGVRVVLAGKPNAGKSSLFNALLKRDRAIVTPHAGTTRDTLEAEIDLHGVPVTMIDTAGLRTAEDEIERMGIERTKSEFQLANLILFLVDSTTPETAFSEYELCRGFPHLIVYNKIDQQTPDRSFQALLEGGVGIHEISAAANIGIAELENAVLQAVAGNNAESNSAMITNRRHQQALDVSLHHLLRAKCDLKREISPEFLLVDLTESVAQIDSITGRQGLDEDVLDELFSMFCLGK